VGQPDSSVAAAPSPEKLADLVRSLAEVMHQSAVTELDLSFGDVAIRLRCTPAIVETSSILHTEVRESDLPDIIDTGHLISAPMIGTFYRSATPSAASFVAEGDEVTVGQTIGIIEAMKIMNEIASDKAGVIQSILVENGQPVEYGSPLIRLLPARLERP
jgi:biotin carboxyl carrier protein